MMTDEALQICFSCFTVVHFAEVVKAMKLGASTFGNWFFIILGVLCLAINRTELLTFRERAH